MAHVHATWSDIILISITRLSLACTAVRMHTRRGWPPASEVAEWLTSPCSVRGQAGFDKLEAVWL